MPTFFVDFGSWLQGVLLILIAYHCSAYLFTKDRSFIIYASYLLLVTIYLIPKTINASSNFLNDKFEPFFEATNWIIQVWYWMLYTWFSIHFLEIEKKNKKLNLQIIRYMQITTGVTTIFFGIDLLFFNSAYMAPFFMFIYMPTSLIIVSFFIRVIYNFKDRINKFFVFGLLFFLGFSLIALYFSLYPNATVQQYLRPIDFFMIGVLLEAIVLSLGLGYKYHEYRKERDNSNQQLILELKKNEELKDLLHLKLLQKVEQHKLMELEATYQTQISELKLTSLLSQMNPHFIFNALNSIKLYIINNDQKNATYYLNKFSKLIRKILEASTKKEVTLEEELETMDLYMSIENIRFSNEIKYETFVDESIQLHTIKIPSLILQPFLENAIWHGLSSKKGMKKVTLSIQKNKAAYIDIFIEDNGIGRAASAKIKAQKSLNRESVGIAITKERLANFLHHNPDDFFLSYTDLKDENNTPTGTKVHLRIPV